MTKSQDTGENITHLDKANSCSSLKSSSKISIVKAKVFFTHETTSTTFPHELEEKPVLALLAVKPACRQRSQLPTTHIKIPSDTQQILFRVLASKQMRPISWVWQQMMIPPTMDGGQHWHEGALEQNSITDANIPVFAKRRDTNTFLWTELLK